VPVNWAIIRGETQTGSTLHVMNEKPDNGALVDQQAVPILPDDSALEVFHKVTCAAEIALYRCLPGLLDGTAVFTPQDLSQGGYFGGRRAEDGRIDWRQSARDIHNLVRAVAPPYPGAFSTLAGKPLKVFRTLVEPALVSRTPHPAFYCDNGRCYAACGDGKVLRVLAFELDGKPVDIGMFAATLGAAVLPLSE
jgi:methionyl-tRNA formyltransferase